MVRVLAVAESPAQLAELAAFVEALGAEAVAVTGGTAGEAGKHSYNVFSKVYAAAGAVLPEQLAVAVSKIAEEYKPDIIATIASKNNVSAIALLAASKGMVMLTEAFNISIRDGVLEAKRRVLGGRAEASYRAPLPVAVAIAKGAYQPGESLQKGAPVEEIAAPEPKVKLLGAEEKKREAVNLEEAEIVIGVGRGFRKKEDLRLAEELAQLLGGVVGASRPIVADYGWLSEDRWIGISGKKIRPKLYMPIGISGAPQHMAAALDSKIIVAVNKDKNAPVFQYADYGVVADLYKFLPVFIKKLRERLGK